MKSSKVMAALVTMGLAAAVATPAMALENQISGAFTTYFDVSNYNPDGNLKKDATTGNYFEQRIRLGYTAKVSEELKLVTKVEFDYSNWGNSSYDAGGPGRNRGGALGADTVNMELKTAYLDWKIPAYKLNAKIGMQPFDDALKGIFVSTDMAGILLTHEYSNSSATAGFFRWDDTSASSLGKNTRDMFMLEGKYNVNKNTRVGAAYYYVNSDNVTMISTTNEDLSAHLISANAKTMLGAASVDGFLAYQFGKDRMNNVDRSAFAGNVGANMPLGSGTVRTELLYVSGDSNNSSKNSFYTPAANKFTQYNYSESGFYDNEMVILSRDKNAFTNDNAIVSNVNNRNQGVAFVSVGYDYPVSNKLTASTNAGFAWVPEKDVATRDSKYLGTEVNAELVYKFAENLSLSGRAGYVVLGDYFKNADINGDTPDDPYDMKLLVKYSF